MVSIQVTQSLLPPIVASLIAFLLYKGLQLVWRLAYATPLHHLRGPKATNFLFGNLHELMSDQNGDLKEDWVKQYGETLRFKGFFSQNHLMTVDVRAVNHILTHSNDYQKPPSIRQGLVEIFGEGLVVVEGTQHRRQRRIMNPAFGPAQIRALTSTFFVKASQLRDVWLSEISKDPTSTITGTRIDIVPWMNRVTLDIIGLAGFNYDFNSLDFNGQLNELSEAFSTILSASGSMSVLDIALRALVPVLRLIPSAESRKIRAAKHTMMQIGEGLLSKAKLAALSSETVEETSLCGRDLLSLLVKANLSNDIPESQRLSDEEVIAQVPTFLFAGQETTSSSAAWALFSITRASEVQKRLRDELLSVDTDTPSMEELIALPYLDAVVREVLRLHPPFIAAARVAMKDDVLPVEKPYVDRFGAVNDTIAIAKGDGVSIPILTINRSKEIWGLDAHEFKPDRWKDTPEAVSRVPGVWAHLLTFINGPRACIGYRFAIIELKAILFSLVRAFEFELAVPANEVYGRTTIAQHPVLRSDPTHQAQLPLLVRSYQKA